MYSAVKSIAWPFKNTRLYDQMIHIAIVGGNGPGGAAEGRIPNLLKTDSGARLASDRAYRRFGAKTTARRAVFSSDLTSMSKSKPWLLVLMALGANLK